MVRSRISCFKRRLVFVCVVPLLLLGMYQPFVFGDVRPGAYKITFDQLDKVSDTWLFYADGTFRSEGLGVTSTWSITGQNTFKVKIDKQEITGFIRDYARLAGLNSSDVKVRIKTLQITGVDGGGTISGDLKIDYDLKIKKPFAINLTTKGTEKFEGELISGKNRQHNH